MVSGREAEAGWHRYYAAPLKKSVEKTLPVLRVGSVSETKTAIVLATAPCMLHSARRTARRILRWGRKETAVPLYS
jgi:hypothetical protein